jgi:hypothetical protein
VSVVVVVVVVVVFLVCNFARSLAGSLYASRTFTATSLAHIHTGYVHARNTMTLTSVAFAFVIGVLQAFNVTYVNQQKQKNCFLNRVSHKTCSCARVLYSIQSIVRVELPTSAIVPSLPTASEVTSVANVLNALLTTAKIFAGPVRQAANLLQTTKQLVMMLPRAKSLLSQCKNIVENFKKGEDIDVPLFLETMVGAANWVSQAKSLYSAAKQKSDDAAAAAEAKTKDGEKSPPPPPPADPFEPAMATEVFFTALVGGHVTSSSLVSGRFGGLHVTGTDTSTGVVGRESGSTTLALNGVYVDYASDFVAKNVFVAAARGQVAYSADHVDVEGDINAHKSVSATGSDVRLEGASGDSVSASGTHSATLVNTKAGAAARAPLLVLISHTHPQLAAGAGGAAATSAEGAARIDKAVSEGGVTASGKQSANIENAVAAGDIAAMSSHGDASVHHARLTEVCRHPTIFFFWRLCHQSTKIVSTAGSWRRRRRQRQCAYAQHCRDWRDCGAGRYRCRQRRRCDGRRQEQCKAGR